MKIGRVSSPQGIATNPSKSSVKFTYQPLCPFSFSSYLILKMIVLSLYKIIILGKYFTFSIDFSLKYLIILSGLFEPNAKIIPNGS